MALAGRDRDLLPNTRQQTIVKASACVGFTLPGMIEEPGSFAGRISSPRPEPSSLISFAILNSPVATDVSAPCANTIASCDASASNLFGAVTNGRRVSAAMFLATSLAMRGLALRPVPTAVPLCASG